MLLLGQDLHGWEDGDGGWGHGEPSAGGFPYRGFQVSPRRFFAHLFRCWDLSAGNMKWIYQVPILAAIVVRIPWLSLLILFGERGLRETQSVRLWSPGLCPSHPSTWEGPCDTEGSRTLDHSTTCVSLRGAHPERPVLIPGAARADPELLRATKPSVGR